MEFIGSLIQSIAFMLFIAFCARYIVAFSIKIRKPRGMDKDATYQVGVEADDAKSAMKKAYSQLSSDQKQSVTKVYLVRDDKEGK